MRCFVKSCHADASPAGQVVVGGRTCLVFILFSIKLPSDSSLISCPAPSLPAQKAVSSCFHHLKTRGGGGAVTVHPKMWI